MTKLRKQRRRKVFKHNVNRKRLRNKINSVGNIGCKEIKDAWDEKKSIQSNLSEMGLSYDPNHTIKIPNKKQEITKKLKESQKLNESTNEEWQEESIEENENFKNKKFVVEALEADAKAPRVKRFQLPKSQVEWITYLMKKYKNDYKAMAKDSKNYYQETWKQLRQKVRTFRKISEQYGKFLEENGVEEREFNSDVSDDEL